MTTMAPPVFSDSPADGPQEGPREHPADHDPAAPWGRKADGTPRAKPGRRRNPEPPSATEAPAAPAPTPRKARGGAGGGRASSGRATPPRRPTKDYTDPVTGAIAVGVGLPLVLIGRATGKEAYLRDAEAVATHSPGIARALSDIAQTEPRVAAALEKVCAAGPYGALLAATIPLALAIGSNHGLIDQEALAGLQGQAQAA